MFAACSLPLVVGLGLPIEVVSLGAEQRLQARGLGGCGAQALAALSKWNLPRSGIELMFPALAGGL